MQKLSGWVKGHAWASVAIAMLLGWMLGSGSGEDAAELSAARSQLAELRSQEGRELSFLESENSSLQTEAADRTDELNQLEEELATAQERLLFLRSKRPIPTFVGGLPAEVMKLAGKFDWNVSVVKQVSSATPGTIIEQIPSPGTTVHSGSDIQLVVAKSSPAPNPVPAAAPAPAEAASSGCDPNYSGACVPQVSYDLNCDDIGGSVTVIGSDPHGFDGDGDGYGCE
jgi:hypothetical protein